MTIFQNIMILISNNETKSCSFWIHVHTDIKNSKSIILPNQALYDICSNNEPISDDIVCSWNMT